MEKKVYDTNLKLNRSVTILQGLSEGKFLQIQLFLQIKIETKRWKNEVTKIVVDKEKIVGNTLLISAYLTYLGPFNGHYRKEFILQSIEKCVQLGLPVKQDFILRKVIGEPLIIRDWGLMGLPADWMSIDSALILTNVKKRWY